MHTATTDLVKTHHAGKSSGHATQSNHRVPSRGPWRPRKAAQEQRDEEMGTHVTEHAQHQQWDQHNNSASAQPLLPLFKCDTHTTTNNHNAHVMSLGHHEE